jgi:hypothetical protein
VNDGQLGGGVDVADAYRRVLCDDGQQGLPAARDAILDWAGAQYRAENPSSSLVEFEHGSATYLFDDAGSIAAERTVLVVGRPLSPSGARDVGYQRGYPLPDRLGGRPVDRGHFMPFSGGGLFGPNLFVQDRALNRGWSAEGRAYRALETRAIGSPEALLSVRPVYADHSDVPAHVELAVIGARPKGVQVDARRFRNRYDLPLPNVGNELHVLLEGATDGQLGALGEETAAVLLEVDFDATIVAMGDAGMPRVEGRQDLDLIVVLDGSLVAVEVKTRYNGRLAGNLTRGGRLPAPRLSRARLPDKPAQASQEYVRARLAGVVDTGPAAYAGVDVVAVVVDLKSMRAQLFDVDPAGRRTRPRGEPSACGHHVETAWARISGHRGHL